MQRIINDAVSLFALTRLLMLSHDVTRATSINLQISDSHSFRYCFLIGFEGISLAWLSSRRQDRALIASHWESRLGMSCSVIRLWCQTHPIKLIGVLLAHAAEKFISSGNSIEKYFQDHKSTDEALWQLSNGKLEFTSWENVMKSDHDLV